MVDFSDCLVQVKNLKVNSSSDKKKKRPASASVACVIVALKS